MFCPRTIVNSNKDVSASAASDGFFSSLKSSNLTEAQHKSLQSLVKKLFNFVSSLKLYALTEENDYLQLLWSILSQNCPIKNQEVTGKYDPQFSSHCFEVRNILIVHLELVTIMKTEIETYS